jgi:hypothetical protein
MFYFLLCSIIFLTTHQTQVNICVRENAATAVPAWKAFTNARTKIAISSIFFLVGD